jgi:hypothetical protein
MVEREKFDVDHVTKIRLPLNPTATKGFAALSMNRI